VVQDQASSAEPTTGNHRLLDLYRSMKLIRRFEETALLQSSLGKVHGALHLSVGQEAVAVGVSDNLRSTDYVASTHRGHAHCLAKGVPAKEMMAELFGRLNGSCKGRGGSMHIADFDRGVIGCNGVVAANLTVSAGVAEALKRDAEGNIIVCFFGEGATNRGPFLEGLNLAATWELPVFYVCEANRYAQYTAFASTTKELDITKRAEALGIRALRCDGMKVLDVQAAARELIGSIRSDSQPALLLADTYRFLGHALGDPEYYRPREEIEAERLRDPLKQAIEALDGMGVSFERIKKVDADVERELEEALSFAEGGPVPTGSSVGEYVYSDRVHARIEALGWEVLNGYPT
jgi:TPP-dependent pyruvate/acetoin dehydrogenase alpha subunit